jgi:ABC-2 type transport system permease protein
MKILIWTLKDELSWLVFWTIAMGGYMCFSVALYPAFSEMFENMMISIPMVKVFLGPFAPELMSSSLLDAFLGLEFFAWFGILVSFYPLIYASSTIVGEIERGTMEILLAQPISRSRVFLEKFTVISVNLAGLCTACFVICLVAISVCVSESPSVGRYAYTFLNSYFLLLVIAAFGFLCSVLISNQRSALSVSAGFVLFNFVFYKGLDAMGVAQWLTRLSPFYYADPIKILATGEVHWFNNFVLLLVAAIILSTALVLFQRKDIAS